MKPAGIEKKAFVETISYKHQYDDYYNDSSDEDDYDYYGNENYTANGKTTTNESKIPLDSQDNSQKPESVPSTSVNGHQTKQSSFQIAANPSISAKQMHESEDLLDFKHAIIHENILKVERFLLKPDVNINVTFNNGWSPLMYAVSVGSYELSKKFIENGADVNHSADKTTVLMCASSCRRVSEESVTNIIKLLVENNANIEAYDRYCLTPLMLASRQNNVAVVKYLIDIGVDVDKQDENGWTSLAHACSKGHVKCVYELLRANANACLVTFDYMYPIDLATSNGFLNIKVLIENYLNNGQIEEPRDIDTDKLDNSDFDELKLFLNTSGLKAFLDLFVKHDITLKSLLSFTENDFAKIGIKDQQVQSKIKNEINKFHRLDWKPNSVFSKKNRTSFNSQEAVLMMLNISRHCDFISSTIKCLNQEISSQNSNFFQEYPNSNSDFIANVKNTVKVTHELHEQIAKLYKQSLNKTNSKSDSDLKQVDSVDVIQKPNKFRSTLGFFAISSLAIFVTVKFIRNKVF